MTLMVVELLFVCLELVVETVVELSLELMVVMAVEWLDLVVVKVMVVVMVVIVLTGIVVDGYICLILYFPMCQAWPKCRFIADKMLDASFLRSWNIITKTNYCVCKTNFCF